MYTRMPDHIQAEQMSQHRREPAPTATRCCNQVLQPGAAPRCENSKQHTGCSRAAWCGTCAAWLESTASSSQEHHLQVAVPLRARRLPQRHPGWRSCSLVAATRRFAAAPLRTEAAGYAQGPGWPAALGFESACAVRLCVLLQQMQPCRLCRQHCPQPELEALATALTVLAAGLL
jgi:hypothetical protein